MSNVVLIDLAQLTHEYETALITWIANNAKILENRELADALEAMLYTSTRLANIAKRVR